MNETLQKHSVDLLVTGGGMAGTMAALAARKAGRSVLLVEPGNVLGGQGTAGGVAGFCGDTARVNGIFGELVRRLARHDLIAPFEPTADRRPYDLEWCAFFLQEMVAEAGVEVLFHAVVVDAKAAGGRVNEVLVATADGLRTVAARVVVDASGRCIVPLKAGFPVNHLGANEQLPMSLYFTLWDSGKPAKPILPPGAPAWEGDEALPMTSLHHFPSGKMEVKMKVVGFDAADPLSLSHAEMFARRQMAGLIYHLQTKGYRQRRYENYVLASVSRHIGVREERSILGEHFLTRDEVSSGAVFADAVAVGTYHFDYHWPDRMERAGTGITTMVEPYQIPLRCLIPKGARNLLVPGRGASGDQMAMSSFRVMATAAQMGFAAGLAADEYLRQNADAVGAIDIRPLQARLEEGGQALDLSRYGQYLRHKRETREFAFGEERPFAQCHASSLVRLPNNGFLIAYFGGTREKHPDVGIWLSERRQGAWMPPRLAAKLSDEPHWNPVLFQSPAGPLILYFKIGPSPYAWRTWMMHSRDEGRTWSAPAELISGDGIARGPVRCKPIVLADGTVLAPGSDESAKDGRHVWRAFIDRSDDGGFTFQPGPLLPLDPEKIPGLGVIQPTLWESRPGTVHMLLRSTCGRMCRSDSTDGGRNWSEMEAIDLPNNNKGVDVTLLADGRLALICNPIGKPEDGNHTPLSILLSSDNGRSWTHRRDLETDPGEYIYPAIIPTEVGMAVSYTWRRERIAFWQGSVESIPAADTRK